MPLRCEPPEKCCPIEAKVIRKVCQYVVPVRRNVLHQIRYVGHFTRLTAGWLIQPLIERAGMTRSERIPEDPALRAEFVV
jgi:hypothetical protein